MHKKQLYWGRQDLCDWYVDTKKYHCARLSETFDNRLFSTFTEPAGATSNNALSIIINDSSNNNNDDGDYGMLISNYNYYYYYYF